MSQWRSWCLRSSISSKSNDGFAMDFLGKRISLNPRPARATVAALEVALLGNCPGRVRIDRLLAMSDATNEIRANGFGPRLDRLISGNEHLHHLPVPINSLAEFEDIFPDARSSDAVYISRLAGSLSWLVNAVEDYFANGGEKLWVIQIPEDEGISGFLPEFNSPLYDVENLRGIATALVLNQVGLIGLPDLERLQIPAHLQDIPRKRLANPDPQFTPASQRYDDGHRERRHSSEMPRVSGEPVVILDLLQRLLGFTNKHRPDIQCLFTLPLSFSDTLGSPEIDEQMLDQLNQVRRQPQAHLLRQVQFLYPYLRSPRYSLRSPVGVVAGLIAGTAQHRGIWRSVAGLPMQTDARPYPEVSTIRKIQLREAPGIGVICRRAGKMNLDDERISVPALFRDDYLPSDDNERLQGMKSAEVVRFLGFLVRQLQALGERLIFNLDYRDPRPRLVLDSFFRDLFRRGALRGRLPEDAYSIRQATQQEAVIAFDIEIAPAFPIDRIQLTFVNRQGEWSTELQHV